MSAFDRWREMNVAVKPRVSAPEDDDAFEEDADDGSQLSESELRALVSQKNDLSAQIKAFRLLPSSNFQGVSDIVELFWKSLKDDANPGANIKYARGNLWARIKTGFTKFVSQLTKGGSINGDLEFVVFIDLDSKSSFQMRSLNRKQLSPFVVSLRRGILAKKFVLFSTTDVVFQKRFDALIPELSPIAADQLADFGKRVSADLAKLDGTLEKAAQLELFVAGKPLVDFLVDRRYSAVKDYQKSNQGAIAIVCDPKGKNFSFLFVEGDQVGTRAQIDSDYEETKKKAVIALDMRDQYGRFRGWQPAVLIWEGDEPSTRPPAEKKKRARRAPKTKSDATEEEDTEDEVLLASSELPLSKFQRGVHPNQAELNRLAAERIPSSGVASTVKHEILRLSVLAVQLAFEGVSLTSLLAPVSGLTLLGDNLFETVVVGRMASFLLDATKALAQTEETCANLDRFLNYIVADQRQIAEDDEPSVVGQTSPRQVEMEQGYHPVLLRFFLRYFIGPFHVPRATIVEEEQLAVRSEKRLRALLKARVRGQIARDDLSLFGFYEKSMAAGSEKEKFDVLTGVVEELTRYYVAKAIIYSVPPGLASSHKIYFTRDLEEAHEYAKKTGNTAPAIKLCEIFDILGNAARIMYGNKPLEVYLPERARFRTAAFYYNIANGLYPGPPPTEETRQNFVFDFVFPKGSRPRVSDDDDDDDAMPTDRPVARNPGKYAYF